jgi:hypothetical protein
VGGFASAFIGAQAKRSRLMARVFSFVAELNKETVTKIQSGETAEACVATDQNKS